jgi:hypothetical protein
MNCFTHEDAAAIAICKYCGRGLCRACAVAGPASVTCKGECEEWARIMHASVRQYQSNVSQGTRSVWMSVFLFGGLGLFSLGIVGNHVREGLPFDDTMQFLAMLGAIFTFFAVALSFNAARKRS